MGLSPSTAAGYSQHLDVNDSYLLETRSKAAMDQMDADSINQDIVEESESDYISNIPDECLACIFQPLHQVDRNRCSMDQMDADSINQDIVEESESDYISNIPDECLACIFQSLHQVDRNRCSLVCRRWLHVEAQSRYHLSLNAHSNLRLVIPSLFSRFDSVTRLTLRCHRGSQSIDDDALIHISILCRKLTRLKLGRCCELTETGMAALAKNCKGLKKFSCCSCTFGAKSMNALLENCSSLEELAVKKFRSVTLEDAAEVIGPGMAASSLKSIYLKDMYNGPSFAPLIAGSKNLRTLKLHRCSGDWDILLQVITIQVTCLVDIHLHGILVGDAGLAAISKCSNLETLHLLKTLQCTDVGLKSVAEHCKLLRKLRIDGWKMNRICDVGLNAVATHCSNLKELVLVGVNPTFSCLERLGTKCPKIERLELWGCKNIGDVEVTAIAEKYVALEKLCIKGCAISDLGIEAIAYGCPNLVKLKVKKCMAVTSEGADRLRVHRESVSLHLDPIKPKSHDINASNSQQEVTMNLQEDTNFASSTTGWSTLLKASLCLLLERNFVACTLRRWSSFG